jgi:hypothetical protein
MGICVLAATAAAAPRRVRAPELTDVDARIVNGVTTTDYAAAGALLDGPAGPSAVVLCSGTLIGCGKFLTAGHCVDGSLRPADYTVFLQHGGFFSVAAIARHPTYDFPVGDVAVLTLGAPVTGIRPARIETTAAPAFGTAATIVGFGRTGPGAEFGLKRRGSVTTGPCANGISDATSICWMFAAPVGAPGSNSNTCNADSGGPLFVDGGGGPTVAGLTSGGTTSTCLSTDHSYDANVFAYNQWIAQQAGDDLGEASCGGVAPVGEPGTTATAFEGTLNTNLREGRHAVVVPAGRSELRVTMNGLDDGVADFDLYVKRGAPPTSADYDCAQNGIGQFASCVFAAPEAGPWYILVDRYGGSGDYQVTATSLGVDCGHAGNEGVACDDGNSCTTGDACVGGVCRGGALADGAACDDGRLCTPVDTCVAGACVGSTAPATTCIKPAFVGGRGSLVLADDPPPNRGDRLSWRWLGGGETPKAMFGSPTTTTDYGICLYDDRGAGPELVLERRIPAGGRWREVAGGYRYSDPGLLGDGIRRVHLHEGIEGVAKITVEARGANLAMTPVPLGQRSTVRLQLVGAGTCWEARYSTSVRNANGLFRARPD